MNSDFSTTSDHNTSNGRIIELHDIAYKVRQYAITSGGDLEGWKLARTMRDASSYAETHAAELKLASWLKARTLDRSAVAA